MSRSAQPRPAETIDCHDYGRQVSFSARTCPACGSTELSGPYRFSRKEARKFRAEDHTDRMLLVTPSVLGALGACYGYATGSGFFGTALAVPGYALLGVTVGVPLGFLLSLLPRKRSQ